MKNFLRSLFVLTLLLSLTSYQVRAEALPPSQVAEKIRASLFTAQMNISSDSSTAQNEFDRARSAYAGEFQQTIFNTNANADESIRTGFEQMQAAITNGSAPEFALARAQTWTAILNGSYVIVEKAIQNNQVNIAQAWLPVREYRTATRFSRPNADATLAIKNLSTQSITTEEAIQFLHADLFDTYQARLNEALRDLGTADQNNFSIRRAELAGLASGYFQILAPAYLEQRGAPSLDETHRLFLNLQAATVSKTSLQPVLDSVHIALDGFRAAPLSPAEQSRRAGQTLRFLSLVPVEYARGVTDGRVTKDLEIQEATTFHEGAYAAFSDLKDLLDVQNHSQTAQAEALFKSMGEQLADASTGKTVASPEAIQSQTNELTGLLKTLIPSEWLKQSSQGDFDVISSMLDQMQVAVRNGEYELAESARLEAYAMVEVGPEAKLIVFAPELKLQIEELFWNGQGEHKGLAHLIKNSAPYSEIKSSRLELEASLKEAQTILGKNTAPAAIATNAGIIVFREGLEAVVILASLMSSLKSAEERKYRQPMWIGTILAIVVTALTWLLAHGLLQSLARYGEKLEAVVSVIAIGVLLLIMNWFFHKTYWTSWLTKFHSQKRRLLNQEAGLWLGLVTLGFTSVYREGFEIVLFLQALVLEGGVGTVLLGVIIALAAVVLVGAIVFRLQKNLPYMKILIITGVMIGAVLLQMVGSTVHIMQVVGWLPIHPIQGAAFSYWLGTWFGVYPTWEGISLQLAALIFVVGSYYLAEGLRKKKIFSPKKQPLKPITEL